MSLAPPLASRALETARVTLLVYIVAVMLALGVTLASGPTGARSIALLAVLPLLSLGIVFLVYERKGRSWSYLGAATLGAVGVVLRLVIGTQPAYEVGGGLPLPVTIAYIGLGLALLLSSAWAAVAVHTPGSLVRA